MHSKINRLYAYNAGTWNIYRQHNSVLSSHISSGTWDYDFRYTVSFETLKNERKIAKMKIVVVKPPKFFRGILKTIFRIKPENI